MSAARTSPSALRNREPIAAVLLPHLPPSGLAVEIASGTGQHAAHLAAAASQLTWQPTDLDPEALASIAAWREETDLPNLLPPLALDASNPDGWPVDRADVILAINMIHISPWPAAQGLMAGAGRILPAGGVLFLYGPYIEADVSTAPSNLAFDESLKARNPAWGVRRLEDVTALAATHGLSLSERVAMPANNLSLVFRKA